MIFVLRCSVPDSPLPPADLPAQFRGEELTVIELPEVPGRRDLKFLDALASRYVVGSTPSLHEIAAQPDVEHLGHPQPDPHRVSERVRVIVEGTDASLAAVVSKLMRIDALWVQVGYVPSFPATSTVAQNWGLLPDATPKQYMKFALEEASRPTALMRDDHGVVVLGAAEITGSDGELVGEAIVDSEVLYSYDPEQGLHSEFTRGVRLVPTIGAPGLAAVPLPSPQRKKSLWGFLRTHRPVDPPVLRGRALQAGGVDMVVSRDGLPHTRPLKSVTFYRHLRDGQFVRT
ncbi:hypothetical protein [Corynebacterium anserum]|uniref:Uncharacterized protein n=1 Tax=Corynebacterium anserum TaxID=2684406 RepID=A0A7G7YLW1_9CORY|nr:hypothetical protein [Corynebacterium anserum]QNH95481.1 hypothetical protein GP473_01095 [Corynebacterium anserum]